MTSHLYLPIEKLILASFCARVHYYGFFVLKAGLAPKGFVPRKHHLSQSDTCITDLARVIHGDVGSITTLRVDRSLHRMIRYSSIRVGTFPLFFFSFT